MSDSYKIFRQLQERQKEYQQYASYEKEELIEEILELQQERDKYKSIADGLRDVLVKEISRMDDLMNKGKPKPYGTEKQYYQTCKCRYVDVLTKLKELEEGEINENE